MKAVGIAPILSAAIFYGREMASPSLTIKKFGT